MTSRPMALENGRTPVKSEERSDSERSNQYLNKKWLYCREMTFLGYQLETRDLVRTGQKYAVRF